MLGHPYAGQRIGFATIHHKDRAAAPPFRRVLGAEIAVAPRVDTDSLGTFSGDIQRKAPLVETCLLKAEMAFDTLDADYAMASEGSYGPIERVPLMASGVELMAFIDRKRSLRIVETLVTHRTNWRLRRFEAGDPDVASAAEAMGFPEYGVFVICGSDPTRPEKNLRTVAEVVAAVDREAKRSDDGQALMIADMRAHRNPMRMKVLRALSWKLASRLQCLCPKCRAPGFGHIDSRRGLPCEDCGEPTHYIHFEVDGCSACGHAVARPRKDSRTAAPRLACTSCRRQSSKRDVSRYSPGRLRS